MIIFSLKRGFTKVNEFRKDDPSDTRIILEKQLN